MSTQHPLNRVDAGGLASAHQNIKGQLQWKHRLLNPLTHPSSQTISVRMHPREVYWCSVCCPPRRDLRARLLHFTKPPLSFTWRPQHLVDGRLWRQYSTSIPSSPVPRDMDSSPCPHWEGKRHKLLTSLNPGPCVICPGCPQLEVL